ncbi:MAG: DnaJ domain-containing protein [Syntrophorhabdales bacterium]|jgi:DnaJ-class molecular chaperone
MNQKDYYQVLDVEKAAGPKRIKEAYRRLAFQYHPDRNKGSAAAVEKMKEINEAYAVLADPEKRARYDMLWEQFGTGAADRFRQSYSEQDIFRGSDINQIFEEMAKTFGFRGFEEIFRDLHGEYRAREFRGPGIFGRVIVFGSPFRRGGRPVQREVFEKPGIFARMVGRLGRYALRKMVGGIAKGTQDAYYDTLTLDEHEAARGGKVVYLDERRSRNLTITIPPGMREGQLIRLKGMGKGRDLEGDLYLKVEIRRPLLAKVKKLLKL